MQGSAAGWTRSLNGQHRVTGCPPGLTAASESPISCFGIRPPGLPRRPQTREGLQNFLGEHTGLLPYRSPVHGIPPTAGSPLPGCARVSGLVWLSTGKHAVWHLPLAVCTGCLRCAGSDAKHWGCSVPCGVWGQQGHQGSRVTGVCKRPTWAGGVGAGLSPAAASERNMKASVAVTNSFPSIWKVEGGREEAEASICCPPGCVSKRLVRRLSQNSNTATLMDTECPQWVLSRCVRHGYCRSMKCPCQWPG